MCELRKLILLLLVTVLFSVFMLAYPTKAVTVVCPWGAGGGTDRVARFFADELSRELGQPFTVVNQTGGGGAVGHGAGAYARADGYTITLVTLEIANMHWLGLTPLTYENFDYIAQINEDAAGVIVKADAPWNSVTELLIDVAMNPGKLMFSGSSVASIWDLSRIGMLDAVGIPVDNVTWIPTTGAAPSIVELLGGHVDVITCSLPEAASQLHAGQLRALAVMADERDPNFPDVPTLKEMGIDWSSGTWRGFAVPNNTPDNIKAILEEAVIKIANSEKYLDFMARNGFGVRVRDSQEFFEFAREQDATWKDVLDLGGYLQ